MKIIHFHMGKEGGAERFFVHLLNAFARRGAKQKAFIRPNRSWRAQIQPVADLYESAFRRISINRFFLQYRVQKTIDIFKPDVLMAWMPRASRMIPEDNRCIKIARLGDYPKKLEYFKNIDILVSNTPGISDHCRSLGWTRRLEVVSNFTTSHSTGPAVQRTSLDTPYGAYVVLGAGRFVKRKGFDTLIKAVAQLDGAYLWLVGEGEERSNLSQLAHREGMGGRVRFTGWKQDIIPYLRACDVCCVPSTHEPLGNVILEAWGSKIPVVSTRSEGPNWFMTDQQDGLMNDIADHDAIARSLNEIRNNPPLRQTLIAGGIKTLDFQFSEKAIVDTYWNLFQQKP